jgi:hypothetical protein
MTEIIYNESDHRFIDPIRYFKKNDPIYWEVQNIPIKQLEENCKWLKDQVGIVNGVSSIGRSEFDELRPYTDETSNVVKIKPGRYLSRINDAYGGDSLQSVARINGLDWGEHDIWQYAMYGNPDIKSKIDGILDALNGSPKFLNGLYERAFVYPTVDTNTALQDYQDVTSADFEVMVPHQSIWTWLNHNSPTLTQRIITLGGPGNRNVQQYADSMWVKKWRGVARTAVVDIPEDLEIAVPSFNQDDFSYIDENGNKQPVANQSSIQTRIDLLFVYSKPVDTSSVTIQASQEGTNTITQPILGLLKGAGVMADLTNKNVYELKPQTNTEQTGLFDGSYPEMLADPNDENDSNSGFKNEGVYGSFPAPEDLLNVTPLLSDQLESEHPSLVGQTVLPIAYIVRRRTGPLDGAGKQKVLSSDIIDIRPFFRTAELSYNERAGIAAAMPSISPANPVVGRMELDTDLVQVKNQIDSLWGSINQGSLVDAPRTVATGYILGGTNYGPESVLTEFYNTTVFGGQGSQAEINQRIKEDNFMPSDLEIPENPSWDIAKWVPRIGTTGSIGVEPEEYVDIAGYSGPLIEGLPFGAWNSSNQSSRLKTGVEDRFARIAVCKKTILLDRSAVGWMGDYHVDVNYLNCAPKVNPGNNTSENKSAGAAGVWVEKKADRFIIYCTWIPFHGIANSLTRLRGDVAGIRGHYVMTDQMMDYNPGSAVWDGFVGAGICHLPSITFRVTGIPADYSAAARNLAGNNPIITLL